MSIAGVVLAAGSSSRLGEPKQLVRDSTGETLVHRTTRVLAQGGCAPLFVVTGAAGDQVAKAVADLDVRVIHNDAWEEGLASSIRAAVNAAMSWQVDSSVAHAHTAIDALLLSVCDMPSVHVLHVRALCEAWLQGASRVASRYTSGTDTHSIGIPAIIGAMEWPRLLELRGDRGAKLLFEQADTSTVPLDGGSFDIDTPSDLVSWRSSAN